MNDPHSTTSLATLYAGKRVLVTGHTGFKGSWLTLWLKELGAQVTGVGLPAADDRPTLFSAARVADGIDSRLADVRDEHHIARIVGERQPEFIFHLAAQPLVRRSYAQPAETYATNVMGTVNVLEAARQCDAVRAVLVVTTDKCYENREWLWPYREQDALGGHDPYSSSKACAEIVTSAYRRSFFSNGRNCGIATARAGNVIGGGDWSEDRLVPDIVRAIAASRPVVLRFPNAVRPWQHVLDVLHGYLQLAGGLVRQPGRFCEAWNFGPDAHASLSVGDLAQRVIDAWGRGELICETPADAPHEAGLLTLDSNKARTLIPWTPVLSIDETIELTVEWYRRYYEDPSAAADASREQLQRFTTAITPSQLRAA